MIMHLLYTVHLQFVAGPAFSDTTSLLVVICWLGELPGRQIYSRP
jgi:hypothetical protein